MLSVPWRHRFDPITRMTSAVWKFSIDWQAYLKAHRKSELDYLSPKRRAGESWPWRPLSCDVTSAGEPGVAEPHSPRSSAPRSSPARCTLSGPSPSPGRWSTGNATCCVPPWCAPRRRLSCCQTCPSPGLQNTGNTTFVIFYLIRTS